MKHYKWNIYQYINTQQLDVKGLFVNSLHSTSVLPTKDVVGNSEANFPPCKHSYVNAAESAEAVGHLFVRCLTQSHSAGMRLRCVTNGDVVALLVGSSPDYFGCRETMESYAKLPPPPRPLAPSQVRSHRLHKRRRPTGPCSARVRYFD